MDVLIHKNYNTFDYISRYSGVPFYYHSEDKREVFGLSKNLLKNTPWVAHQVVQTDTLDALALKYYNNPSYWWVIAYFNDIEDSFMRLSDLYQILKIPTITAITFGDLR